MGTVYAGSLTLPLRDFTYVIKIQSYEMGITGVREAVMLDGMLRSKHLTSANGELQGWIEDIYDKSVTRGVARNISEAEEFDAILPTHAPSRLRCLLRQFQSTLKVDKNVKREKPAFEFETS